MDKSRLRQSTLASFVTEPCNNATSALSKEVSGSFFFPLHFAPLRLNIANMTKIKGLLLNPSRHLWPRETFIYILSCTTQKAKENGSRPKPTALRALLSNQCPAPESCSQSCRRYSNGRLLLFFLVYFSSSISCEQTKGKSLPPFLQSEFKSVHRTQGSVLKVSATGGLPAKIIRRVIYT